ncbi:hypothetical protein ONZ45_g9449 [Pleurotus djamor]|nr:hypothetical protein ONZ45_g9449 [Pleurotus djamor]
MFAFRFEFVQAGVCNATLVHTLWGSFLTGGEQQAHLILGDNWEVFIQIRAKGKLGKNSSPLPILAASTQHQHDPWEDIQRGLQERIIRLDTYGGAQPYQPDTAAERLSGNTNDNQSTLFSPSNANVDFNTRFDRLERQLDLLNTKVPNGPEAFQSTQFDTLSACFDRLEKRLEDFIKAHGSPNDNRLDELNVRFDRLERRLEELSLNETSQACGSCSGLTITVRHGGSP